NDLVAMRHLVALVERNLVVIAPFVDAHFLAHDLDCWSGAVGDIFAIEKSVDRNGSIVPGGGGPGDVLWTKRRVTPKETFRVRRSHGGGVDLRHVPLVKFYADVAFDPRKGILLANRDQHVVAFEMLIRFAGRDELAASFGIVFCFHLFELDAGELAVFVSE